MITKLRLANWKSHINSELNFSPGVNVLVGIMGSGKSSAIEAISFALFGTFPNLQSRKVALDELIMKRPQKQNKASIEIDFLVEGNAYTVMRVIETGKGTVEAEIRQNGKLVDVSAEGVTREVKRVLQMDYDLFSKAVYSEQNGLDYFLKVPKGQRMDHIDRMLKVDRFEKARESVVSISNKIKQKREEKLRYIADLEKENLPQRIEKVLAEITALSVEREKLDAILKSTEQARSELENNLEHIEANELKQHNLKRQLEGAKMALAEIESGIKIKQDKLAEVGKVDDKIKLLASEIAGLKKEHRELKDKGDDCRNKIASINTEMRLLSNGVKDLEKLGAKCPVCESDITNDRKHSLIGNRKGQEQKLRDDVNRLVSELGPISVKVEELDKSIRKKEIEKEKLSTLLDDVKEIEQLRSRHAVYSGNISKFEAELSALDSELGRTDLKKLRADLQEKTAQKREAAANLSALKEKISDRVGLSKDLKSREQLLLKYKGESEGDENVFGKLNTFSKVLQKTQEQLRQEFVKTVNIIMEGVWPELYTYGDFDGIRLTIDGDYILQLKDSTGWVPVEGVVSGGERSLACLALRIAFSHAFIPNLKWLVLDEPTHNLDSNAIENLAAVLRDKISAFAEQVFIITHDERISEGIGNVCRLERNKTRNEPTRIVGM